MAEHPIVFEPCADGAHPYCEIEKVSIRTHKPYRCACTCHHTPEEREAWLQASLTDLAKQATSHA